MLAYNQTVAQPNVFTVDVSSDATNVLLIANVGLFSHPLNVNEIMDWQY